MNINEAKDMLLDIMEAVEETGDCYNCIKCPFRNIITSSDCPFDECPGMWELRGEEI
ncbi:MAG: hypothetical protein ACI4EA_08110 [Candidatus Ornithomonoglobus sp.]